MIMLDKKKAGLWIKIGAVVVALSFILTLMPALRSGDLGGFFSSIFKGSTGSSADTQAQAQIIQLKAKLDKSPKDKASWIGLGNAYFDTGKYQNAIAAYQKVLALDPTNYDVMTDMGVAYNALNQNDKALEIFKKVTGAKPDHAMAWFNLGVIYKSKNDVPNMKFAWERFLTLQPTGAQADNVRQELAAAK